MLWAVYADTYEPEGAGASYPVTRHIFYGKSRAEAEAYHEAHRKTCEFLTACEDAGRFRNFPCPTTFATVKIPGVPEPGAEGIRFDGVLGQRDEKANPLSTLIGIPVIAISLVAFYFMARKDA